MKSYVLCLCDSCIFCPQGRLRSREPHVGWEFAVFLNAEINFHCKLATVQSSEKPKVKSSFNSHPPLISWHNHNIILVYILVYIFFYFLNSFIGIEFTCCMIYPFNVYNSMVFRSSQGVHPSWHSILEHFISSERNPVPIRSQSLSSLCICMCTDWHTHICSCSFVFHKW